MSTDLAKNNRVRVVAGEPASVMPCALCGAPLPHMRVEPFEVAKLIYRATVAGPHVFVPVKHSQGGFCADPDIDTAHFWRDDGRREAYKRIRRAHVDRIAHWGAQ